MLNYCLIEGTAHFAITDGRRWEIYETHKPVPISEKQVVSFDLLDASSSDVCLKALALWRQNIASGQVGTAHTPVVTPTDDAPAVVQYPELPVAAPPTQATPIATPPDTVADANNKDWIPLMSVQNAPQRGIKEIEVLLPDNSRLAEKYWQDVVRETVLWLINNGHLKAEDCPVKPDRGKLYILHTQPYHSDGTRFKRHIEAGPLFLNPDYGMGQHIRNLKTIIQQVGQDPSQFKVRW